MIDCIPTSEFETNRPEDYCSGLEMETEDEYAEYFAKAMNRVCRYKVIKGAKEHLNTYKYQGKYYEDRDHLFIDLSLNNLLHVIDAPIKFCQHNTRIRIRNMALKILTINLNRCY